MAQQSETYAGAGRIGLPVGPFRVGSEFRGDSGQRFSALCLQAVHRMLGRVRSNGTVKSMLEAAAVTSFPCTEDESREAGGIAHSDRVHALDTLIDVKRGHFTYFMRNFDDQLG